MQAVEFTAHNVRLDDGTLTKPDEACSIEAHPWFVSAQRILQAVFPGTLANVRLADLGCLEGGFAVEFARLGMQEQFDGQGPQLAESMLHGAYRHGFRGTFIGIKTGQPA